MAPGSSAASFCLPRQSSLATTARSPLRNSTRSGSFHVNEAPVRAAGSVQRICPKCPSPSCHRGHCLEIRLEP